MGEKKTKLPSRTRSRVLLISNAAWYLQNFRARLVECLESGGLEVVLAAPPDHETNTTFFSKRRFEAIGISRKGRNPFKEFLTIVAFISLFRRVRPDAVLTWTSKPNLYGGFAGRLLRVPVIPNISGLGFVFIRGGLLMVLVGWLYRVALSQAPVVFFQNQEDRGIFVSHGWVDPERAQRLPGSGVNLEYFAFQPLSPICPFVFLYIGRLLVDKGLRELVEASAMLREDGRRFVLRIAGSLDAGNPAAISESELDRWVADGTVEYLGTLTDVRPALVAAHCVVLPSYREGVPHSLLEAAAIGRPIITTDAPGCRETVVSGKSGLLCRLKSANSLAACMAKLLDCSFEKLTTMGQVGRRHAEQNFAEELVVDAYLKSCKFLNLDSCIELSKPASSRRSTG